MTGRIVGFVSRAEAGLRGPKSISKKITPQHGGVAVHYGGPRQPAADPGSDHARCVATWKSWQNYHMNTHGWSDIAYTGGFCQHGFALAGRGAKVRTAANGTNAGNQNYYAITWIGGEGQTPTQEALDAADWWIDNLRRVDANTRVKPHRFFKSTGCPGNPLVSYASSRDGQHIHVGEAPAPAPTPDQPAPTPAPSPTQPAPTPAPAPVTKASPAALQRAVRTNADGKWGPTTDKHCNAVREASNWGGGDFPYGVKFTQRVIGTKVDGKWGPNSSDAHTATVSAMQRALLEMGFDPTGTGGTWGPHTEAAYQAARRQFRI